MKKSIWIVLVGGLIVHTPFSHAATVPAHAPDANSSTQYHATTQNTAISSDAITRDQQSVLTNQELFEGKHIVILGGTGYLGRGIATEVLKYNPKRITILSRDEVKHFNLIKIFGNNPKIYSIIGDIRDYNSVLHATSSADIVFQVAALKRMDALESNVEEAIRTNVLGSLNVFHACVANKVPKVLFVSTDKACMPINIYGACKFASEKIFTNYDTNAISTKFMVSRFGNILESTGSVIPIFVDKIRNGDDLTLTDERMTRFIITKEEASKLLFDALRYGNGGEIFVRHTSALKITDLIAVLKRKFNAHNTITVTGLRPGEKFHEVLVNRFELERTYAFQDCLIVRSSIAYMFEQEQPKPLYMTEGKRVDGEALGEYSSDRSVISQRELAELFDAVLFRKLNLWSEDRVRTAKLSQ